MGNPEAPESTTNQLGSTPQSVDHVSSSTISLMPSSISDCITEESVVCSHDRKGLPSDSIAIKPESLTDALQENENTNAGEDVTKWPLAYVAQETGTKGIEETNLDRNLTDSMVSPSRFAGESFESVSKLEETVGRTPDPVPADRAVESVEEHDDGSSSKMSQNYLPPEVGSADHVSASIGNSQVKVDAAQEVNHASSGNIIDSGNSKEEGNDNVDVLPVPGDSANHVNASQILVGAAEGIPYANSSKIIEGCNRKEEGNENVNILSVPDDTSILDPPENMVEDLKENKGVRLQEYAILDSCAKIADKEDSADDSASEKNSSTFQSRQLSEGTEMPASDILEVSGEREGGRSKAVANEVLVEEEADVSLNKFTIDEVGASVEVVAPDIDENHIVRTHEEQEINDIHNNEIHVNYPENATKLSADTGINQATNLLGKGDAGNLEKAWTEGSDAIGDNNGIGATEKNYTEISKSNSESAGNLSGDAGKFEKAWTEGSDAIGDNNGIGATETNYTEISKSNSESAGNLSESLFDPTLDLPQGDEAGVHGKGKIEKCDVGRIESREGLKEDKLSMKSKVTSQSTSSFHESQTVADDIIDGSVKLSEHESLHLDGVSYSRIVLNNSVSATGIKEEEISGNDKVQVESLGVSTANESYHGGDVLQKTSEDHMVKESHVSPLETESSVQSSDAVEDNHAREFGGGASAITSESLEGESNFVKQQSVTSAVDVSVDSFSQTDSLEGNWGSVSGTFVILSMRFRLVGALWKAEFSFIWHNSVTFCLLPFSMTFHLCNLKLLKNQIFSSCWMAHTQVTFTIIFSLIN